MSLLLQISDTHFGIEQRAVMEALFRLVREQVPDVVVLSGDITQRARRALVEKSEQAVPAVPTKRLVTCVSPLAFLALHS
jgi:3',5'-cyclic AMP phosphodiesterase CpdA